MSSNILYMTTYVLFMMIEAFFSLLFSKGISTFLGFCYSRTAHSSTENLYYFFQYAFYFIINSK